MKKDRIVKACRIMERSNILHHQYINEDVKNDNIQTWISRKSLCSEEMFYKALKISGINEKDFALGIKQLDDTDNELLREKMGTFEWFVLFNKIFSQKEIFFDKVEMNDFSYAFRYHIKFIYTQIVPYEKLLGTQGIEKIIAQIVEEFLNISMKTMVNDLHILKDDKLLIGNTSEERFLSYLSQRFGSKKFCKDFFNEYPVLARLLVERVQFHIQNCKIFVDAMNESEQELEQELGIKKPYIMNIESLGAGDSHSGGKAVMIITINQRKIVFKYKNLEIAQRLDMFLEKVESYNEKSEFYKIKRIVKNKYTIEEFVSHNSCETKEEIEKYYYRFGEYVAICYFLCGNDFHYENLVAHGEYPVLIDVETIIQNESAIKTEDSAYSMILMDKYQSVLSTGLLPTEYMAHRIEPYNENKKNKGIQMSALTGREDELPFKVLKLSNPNTDNVKFEYMEHKIENSNNLPLLNGKYVELELYKKNVLEGFKEQYLFFMKNKEILIKDIERIFSNVEVRNVLKATQKYGDMLDFGYHPKCMNDYIEREKLFENLWSFSYKVKDVIRYEIEDLLVNDIPIFFNNTSKTSILTSKQVEIPNFYEKTAIQRVQNRINELNKEDFKEQLKYLLIALDLYEDENRAYEKLNTVENIVGNLLKRAVCGEKNTVSWKDLINSEEGWDYNNLPINLYDGISGIYILLLHSSKGAQGNRVIDALEEAMFKEINAVSEEPSVYIGPFSILYPLYQKIKLYRKNSDIKYAERIVEKIKEYYVDNTGDKNDWLSGKAGLIKVLLGLFEITKKDYFLEVSKIIADRINLGHTHLCGLAHGYSGIMIAMACLYNVTGDSRYKSIVHSCLALENKNFKGRYWEDLREKKQGISQWCHGTTGIGLARLELIKRGFSSEQVRRDLVVAIENVLDEKLDTDCLCHGNVGNIYFLEIALKNNLLPVGLKNRMTEKINQIKYSLIEGPNLQGFEDNPTLGLMTGLSGIGYWLFSQQEPIPNILLLD